MNATAALEIMLQVRGLTKVFGEGESAVRAVDNVDLDVNAGELVLVMGPSGSGKTTLLTMIGGLLHPTAGSIVINGMDITTLPERRLVDVRRRLVGFIFQTFSLWESLTVIENIELALNIGGIGGAEAEERARRLLEERALSKRAFHRPQDLSGGEKQRLAIARALANEPRLLLADEPTANLDSQHGRDIMRLLARISRESGRAVVVVSHDRRIREVADRVLWLEDGRLRDMGRLAVDPVCGMPVEPRPEMSVSRAGRSIYFCADGCRQEFLEQGAGAEV